MKQRVKYYETVDPINIVAHILDPRFKCAYMQSVYQNNEVETIYKPMIYRMYRDFNALHGYNVIPGLTSTTVSTNTSRAFLVLPPTTAESELTGYLQADCEPYGIDDTATLMTWWRNNSLTRYPRVSRFARSVLAVPATSVPSECTFSTSGRVIDEYRSSLNPSTVEALMMYGDWLRKKPLLKIKVLLIK
jgi:hypothetical protein